MTHLCVSIPVTSAAQALAQAALAAERGADLVEYRLDRFPDAPGIAEIVARSPLPSIVTLRPVWEGGHYDGSEADRVALLEQAAKAQPAYLDLELAANASHAELRQYSAKPERPRLILSSHDFVTRPADLVRRVRAMADDPWCDVVKLAWRARSLRDNIEAFELLRDAHKPTIALCMGEFGLPSRVLAKKFNALLTFTGLDDDATTAPGQVGVTTMKRLYRWDALDAATQVFGVIGHPIGHSMSPALHNAGFDAVGFNAVYLPMPILPEYEQFKATVAEWLAFKPLDFRGASVTIPHKENLLRFVRESGGKLDPLCETIGAANTLAVQPDGSLFATNTDYAAAIDSVCAALKINRRDLTGRRVAVIGAGGAARAIVAAFAHYGSTVVIYNRTLDRARQLAADLAPVAAGGAKIVAAPLENLCKSCCEVYINATPIGMHPHVEATPMPELPPFSAGAVVFDTIYNPIETRLIREARAAGAKTVSGLEMFVRQAAAQFELWTAQPAPTDLFEKVVREKLAAR